MFATTMLLTVGRALDRAKDDGSTVRLLVAGEWVTGRIVNSDGHGVAVLEGNGDLCVVVQSAITCVRMPAPVSPGPHVPQQSEFVSPGPRHVTP